MEHLKQEEILTVGGMSCSGCELRIEEKLKSLPGVESVSASFSKGKVRVRYDPEKTNRKVICGSMRELGYTVDEGTKPEQVPPKQKESISFLFGTILVLAALYVIIQHTVGFGFINFIPQINQNMSYGILFVVGLFTSIHCLAM